ncbi:cation diffusion facilitator family transporter [Gordonia sp. (in: high G+C Gram-positive bacteria)]|jgi:cation diffusion facilitator family transporter|uniref:cation diffusion facilitator family transporter n=1 Tax=Gordonia sp. (in: high G+C Gram-positive bacteria) TaxID=84139 RepID=UPI001D3734CB|nr:cation diffusion facilitator family transporter [Gordonia sp. (in: high G+C Gram-positive bacteria)]MCB1294538.1 cation transporter [Gordonia sp. (in: high G+C Gram-positive bacteria)]HMS75447.1 cation diffusion facilitator family transporter [Gordonia sp. (in: high G+C Gram-positive bacteria)]HQV18805.1 cation diffusion facilitator family transporter [Gordonia sp. (in: high G+C Gram-positive bacteria)]
MAHKTQDLSRWALLSIAAAALTIALKTTAWLVTGSVGLLSDAAESVVNLVAAVVAFVALKVAARPADANHNFGHQKSEYFSAIIEGTCIAIAAVVIIISAVERLLNPKDIESAGIGLLVSVIASMINGAVALALIRAGRRHRSVTLEADGKHLATDVWTTAGILIAIALVAITGWNILDPIVAIAVAVNILFVGGGLVGRAAAGLMDTALPDEQRTAIDTVLGEFSTPDVMFHDVRTRESGHIRFVQMHMLVPGDWSVQRAHDLAERVESHLEAAVDDLFPTIHIEPIGDPRAYEDWRLEETI